MNVTYDTSKEKFVTIDQEDKIWWMTDGYALVARASLQVSPLCPKEYRDMLNMAIARHYIYPTATMKEKEYVWATLEK
jgi:hypothetical protein